MVIECLAVDVEIPEKIDAGARKVRIREVGVLPKSRGALARSHGVLLLNIGHRIIRHGHRIVLQWRHVVREGGGFVIMRPVVVAGVVVNGTSDGYDCLLPVSSQLRRCCRLEGPLACGCGLIRRGIWVRLALVAGEKVPRDAVSRWMVSTKLRILAHPILTVSRNAGRIHI